MYDMIVAERRYKLLEKPFTTYRNVYVSISKNKGIKDKYCVSASLIICDKCFKNFVDILLNDVYLDKIKNQVSK